MSKLGSTLEEVKYIQALLHHVHKPEGKSVGPLINCFIFLTVVKTWHISLFCMPDNYLHSWQECSRTGDIWIHWLCTQNEDRGFWTLLCWTKEITSKTIRSQVRTQAFPSYKRNVHSLWTYSVLSFPRMLHKKE